MSKKLPIKQVVYRTSKNVFEDLKGVLKELAEELDGQLCTIDKHAGIQR